jgi:hypothetical protein
VENNLYICELNIENNTMNSSQNKDLIMAIFSDKRSVFTLNDVAMLVDVDDFKKINERLNYYVRKGKLQRPRKGIYTKQVYNIEELICSLYTPSYISLEYVLQKWGIVFQYDERITAVSYLRRTIEVENKKLSYRKVKGEILVSTEGINRNGNINIATPERAFLDLLYLNGDTYFDNINPLDIQFIKKLLPIYNSKALVERVAKLLNNG